MQTVIMAGGRGTRIALLNSEVPKPMIPICGKPILQYAVECLVRQGFKDITMVVGYLRSAVKNYFGDGSAFGARIDYIEEEEPLGTAGALFYLKDKITDDFLLLNGDVVFDADIARFAAAHKKNGCAATVFTHPNSHPYDSGIIIADQNGKVLNWLHKEDERLYYRNRVNAGLHMLSPSVLKGIKEAVKTDLDRDILKPLIASGQLYVYDSPEYVKDMGTPDRFYAVEKDILSGKTEAKNLCKKQRAVFLDRDGTLNKYVGFLTDINKLELTDGACEAVKKINESGRLAIVVSNQPVIARGEVTPGELDEIHNKLETLLGAGGAYLDGIYFCPHHPDKGFPGERPEYKIDCGCRKPRAGMIFKAAEKFNIELADSWMIGDGENDVLCGKNAGCKTAYIGEGPDFGADLRGRSLLDCVNKILD